MKNRIGLLLALLTLAFVWTNNSAIALVYQGLTNTSLGSATLAPTNNQLIVSNIGTSGQDGVSIAIPTDIAGLWQVALGNLDPSNALPVGAFVQSQEIGTAGNITNGVLSTLMVTKEGTGNFAYTANFSPLGVNTFHVLAYLNGELVAQAIGTNGVPFVNAGIASLAMSPNVSTGGCACLYCPCANNPDCCISVNAQSIQPQLMSGFYIDPVTNHPANSVFSGNFEYNQLVCFTDVGDQEQLQHVYITASQIPTLTITNENVLLLYQGLVNSALGNATLSVLSNQLTAGNIGTNGQDGVSIALNGEQSFEAQWQALDPSNALPVGAYVQSQITGATGVLTNGGLGPVGMLGSIRVTKLGTSDYVTAADFTSLGSTSATVQVYNGNTLVAQANGQTGPLYTVATLPNGGGYANGQTQPADCKSPCNPPPAQPDPACPGCVGTWLCCITIYGNCTWISPLPIVLPNGTTNVGNRVVVSPEGATATIGKLSAQQIVAANISSLTITNESVSFPPFQITDIGVSGSNVVLSWNTQGITNAVQVTTNTTGGYSPSNFVNLATIPVVTTPTTNYIDMGGATNKPTRYYRISQPLP